MQHCHFLRAAAITSSITTNASSSPRHRWFGHPKSHESQKSVRRLHGHKLPYTVNMNDYGIPPTSTPYISDAHLLLLLSGFALAGAPLQGYMPGSYSTVDASLITFLPGDEHCGRHAIGTSPQHLTDHSRTNRNTSASLSATSRRSLCSTIRVARAAVLPTSCSQNQTLQPKQRKTSMECWWTSDQ